MKAQPVLTLDTHDSSLQNTAVVVVVVQLVMSSVGVRRRPVVLMRASVTTDVLLVILVEVKALTVGETTVSGLVAVSAKVRAVWKGKKHLSKFMTEMFA